MATTTNYGWTTPDDSDLVKDGASAIRSLGAAIDGTFLGLGKNVIQTVKLDTFTTNSTTYTDVTGLTATITPSSASAKIMIIADLSASAISGGTATVGAAHFRIDGGNADSYVGTSAGSRVSAATTFVSSGALQLNTSQTPTTLAYLDSPASTSPVTYAVQVRTNTGGTAVINRSGNDADQEWHARTASSITAIEVYA